MVSQLASGSVEIDHRRDTPVSRAAYSRFSQLFGEPLDLWVRVNHCWLNVRGASGRGAADKAWAIPPLSLPEDLDLSADPLITEIAPGVLRITTALPLADAVDDADAVAAVCGTVRSNPRYLIESLLHSEYAKNSLRGEVNESRSGLAPHLEQISHDFEELTWLRRLNMHIEYRDIGNSVINIAQKVMPDLCGLIKAESLVFVSSVPKGGSVDIGTIVAQTGRIPLDPSRVTHLIQALRPLEKAGQPLVLNHLPRTGRLPEFAEVASCIHIPAMHHGTCFGWLLALNRVAWEDHSPVARDQVPTGLCEDEFGTCEASLIHAAAGTLAAHAYNATLFREKELLLIGVIRAMINAIDAKDSYTCGHSDRVAIISKCIGEELELDARECERLYTCGLLHDIGKIGVPDHVLKKPARLSDEEYAIIKKHPTVGFDILNHMPELEYLLPGVLHHHEEFDGSGYPLGLKGEAIPLFGRILAVADSYDAMTSSRPYRTAMPTAKAEGILLGGAGTQWDPRVVDAFMRALPTIQKACDQAEQQLPELLRTPVSANPLTSDPLTRAVVMTRDA